MEGGREARAHLEERDVRDETERTSERGVEYERLGSGDLEVSRTSELADIK